MKKPIRIGLIMQGGDNWLGGIEYIKNIIFALASLPPEVRSTFEVCLICSNQLSDVAGQVSAYVSNTYYFDTTSQPSTLLTRIRRRIARKLFGQSYSPPDSARDRAIDKAKIDFTYPYATTVRRRKPFRSAAWIPDCQHKYLTQFFLEQEIQARDKWFASIANNASVIVLSSKTAEADFNKFFFKPTYKSEVLSFRVYPLSEWYEVDPLEIQEVYNLPDRFFIINNQFWQHKNHLIVFEALKILQNQAIYPVIVCTGNLYDYRNPSFLDITLQTIARLGVAHQVYLLGIIKRSDMVGLMRRALAVIQPSLFEGWSTVVEEARCLGKPVILSDIPVHKEQDPPNAVFFESSSAEHLATVLADFWKNLTPGPKAEEEATARNNNLREVQEFGYRFLEIAKG